MRIKQFLSAISDDTGALKGEAAELIDTMSYDEFKELIDDLKASVELDEAIGEWNTKVKAKL